MPLPILAALALQQSARYGARKVAAYTGRKILGQRGRKIATKTGIALNKYGQPALYGYFITDSIKEAQKGNTAGLDLMSIGKIPGAGKVLSRLPGLGRKTELGKKLEKSYEKYGGGIQTTSRMGGPGMGFDTHIAASYRVLQDIKTKSGKPTETAVLVQRNPKVDKSNPVFDRASPGKKKKNLKVGKEPFYYSKKRPEDPIVDFERNKYGIGGEFKGWDILKSGKRVPRWSSKVTKEEKKYKAIEYYKEKKEAVKKLAYKEQPGGYERRDRKLEDLVREEEQIRKTFSSHVDEIIKKGDPVNRLYVSRTDADQRVAKIFLEEARKKGLYYSTNLKGINRIIVQDPKIEKKMLEWYKTEKPAHIYGNVWGSQKKPKVDKFPTKNIWHGSGENKELSNLALRPFKYQGREYKTVEHAYQTLKTGKFDEATYSKQWGEGVKIRGGKINKNISDQLMKDLITESFKQNPKAMAKLKATGSAELTHTQDTGHWGKKFPAILTRLRREVSPKPKTEHEKNRDFVLSQEVAQRAMYQQFRSAKSTVKLDGRKVWSSPGRSILITSQIDRSRVFKPKDGKPELTYLPPTYQMERGKHWDKWMKIKLEKPHQMSNINNRGKYKLRKEPEQTIVHLETRKEKLVDTHKRLIDQRKNVREDVPIRYNPKTRKIVFDSPLPPRGKQTYGWDRTYGKGMIITINGKKVKIGPMSPAEMRTVVETDKQLKLKLKQGDLPRSGSKVLIDPGKTTKFKKKPKK